MKEAAIKVGGKVYTLTALDAQALLEIHEEFQASTPSHVDELVSVAKKLPEAMQEAYIKANLNNAINSDRLRKSLDSAEFQEWMSEKNSLNSAARIYHKMFRKHHPELTREDAFNLAVAALEEGGADAFRDLFPSKLESAKAVKGRRNSVPSK